MTSSVSVERPLMRASSSSKEGGTKKIEITPSSPFSFSKTCDVPLTSISSKTFLP